MPPKVNNLTELNQYLGELEKRIMFLEKGMEIQANQIHDLMQNPTSKANNKDVINYLKRVRRNKIIVRISLAIAGCFLILYLLVQISNAISKLLPVGPLP